MIATALSIASPRGILGPECRPRKTCVQVFCSSNQNLQAPLLHAIQNRVSSEKQAPLHVPGHKGGEAVHITFKQLVGEGVLKADLTELRGLDYLSSPAGVILDAQRQAAQTFGADATWFLVNGCTVGIHAAVLATCGPGDVLLLARNCHLSAFSAMVLAGCEPCWLLPECDPHHGVAHCITPDILRGALDMLAQQGKRAAAILLVSPTYFGACAYTKEVAAICHEHELPLIVDEAHGAHLGLHSALPAGALALGADLVVQSTHKTLSAMTQAAMLHMKGARVDAGRVSRALQVLQSSSPSYVLLASLDAATLTAADPQAFDVPLAAAQLARSGLAQIAGISVLGPSTAGAMQSVSCWDPLRIVVNVEGLAMTGYEAAEQLEDAFGVVPELATLKLVVLAMGPGSLAWHAEAVVEAFKSLAASATTAATGARATQTGPETFRLEPPVPPKRLFSPRDAFWRKTERVPSAAAVGRASAELLCPYPPGVPAIYPGELVSQEAVALLQATMAGGGAVTGASDATLQTMLVLSR